MRRMKLVLQELDRVHKEKGELELKTIILFEENSDLQKLVHFEDNIDKANKHF